MPLITDNMMLALTLDNTPNDASGNGNNFSNTGSPTYITNGNPYDYGLFLNGSSTGLTIADGVAVSPTGELTLYITVIPLAKTGTTAVFSKDDFGVVGARSYSIVCNGTADRWQFEVWTSSNVNTTISADIFGSIQLNVPQTIVARVTAAGVASIQVNGGTPDTASGVTSIRDSATNLDIGTRRNNGTATSFFNGIVRGPVILAKRAWTDSEVGYVYRGGDQRKITSSVLGEPQFIEPLITALREVPRHASLHYNTLTFDTAANYELGQPADMPASTFAPTDYDHWENYFDQLEKLGIQQAWITSKHWNGFCLWPSRINSYNISDTPFYDETGIDVLKDFCDAAHQRGLTVGLYYCVKCEFYDEEYTGDLTREEYTLAMLSELLGGSDQDIPHPYGLFAACVLDGYGDNFWDTSDGWSYTDVNHDTLYNHIKHIQPECLITVNDHDDAGVSLPGAYRRFPGDFRMFEVPIEGIIPENYYNQPLGMSWPTIHPNWTDATTRWFEHSDSVQPVPTDMQVPIGDRFRTVQRGGVSLLNICAGPTGKVPSALQAAASEFWDRPATTVLEDQLFATAGTTLQSHNAAWSKTAGGADILINPSGSAYSNNDFIEYGYTGSSVTGDFYAEIYFSPLTLTQFQVYLVGQKTGSTDVRIYVTRSSGGVVSVELHRNNSGLVLLDSFTMTGDLTAGGSYRLKLFKIGNELRGEFMQLVGDYWYAIGRTMETTSHTSAGTMAMGLFETNGTSTTGLHVTYWRTGSFVTTGPAAATLALDDQELVVTKSADTASVKIFRSNDSGENWIPAGYLRRASFTSNVARFKDGAISNTNDYQWKAISVNSSLIEGDESNLVGYGSDTVEADSQIRFVVVKDGAYVTLDDAPVLSSPTGGFGLVRTDTNVIVIADGTEMTASGTLYSADLVEPEENLTYRYYVEAVVDDVTYWVGRTTGLTRSSCLVIGRYTDSTKLADKFGADNVHKFMALDDGDEAIDYAMRMYQHIADAEQELDDRLFGAFVTGPFEDETPRLISQMATALAGVLIYEAQGSVDLDSDGKPQHRYEAQRTWVDRTIKKLKYGRLRLDGVGSPTEAPNFDTEDL